MKVLVDATNIKVGGGIQVAVSVITELSKNTELDFTFVVSSFVAEQLNIDSRFKLITINTGAKTLLPFAQERAELTRLSDEFDVVFSVFGPCFWKANKTKHIIGFANAWLVNPDTPAYGVYPFLKRLKFKLQFYVLGKLLYRKDAFYITETESVRQAFIDFFGAQQQSISVVPNTLPYVYERLSSDSSEFSLPDELKNKFKFVCISFNYPHKNLKIIEQVGERLESQGVDFVFVITFPASDYEAMSAKFKKYTYNVGPVDILTCPSLYRACDALFLPTLIECFSVSYLEAMQNRLPILTSEYEFAKDVCGDSAIYFDPLCPRDIADKALQLINSRETQEQLIRKGETRINAHPKNSDKVQMYLEQIKSV